MIVAGYALAEWFPEALLQLVIGTLLLIFGLQWLRKAVLRSAGLKSLHDEQATFDAEEAAAREAPTETVMGLDWFAFVVSFKGVFLEGLEVVFIVLTFGVSAGNVPLAAAGSVRRRGDRPRHRGAASSGRSRACPENTIKYGVGILLSTFGTFWAIEGLGVFSADGSSLEWPAGDLALLAVLARLDRRLARPGRSRLRRRAPRRRHDLRRQED